MRGGRRWLTSCARGCTNQSSKVDYAVPKTNYVSFMLLLHRIASLKAAPVEAIEHNLTTDVIRAYQIVKQVRETLLVFFFANGTTTTDVDLPLQQILHQVAMLLLLKSPVCYRQFPIQSTLIGRESVAGPLLHELI